MAIKWDVELDTSGFDEASKAIVKEFDNMVKKAEFMGESVDEVAQTIEESMKRMKSEMYDTALAMKETEEHLNELDSSYEKLQASMEAAKASGDTHTYEELQAQYNALGKEIDEEKGKFEELAQTYAGQQSAMDALAQAHENASVAAKKHKSAIVNLIGGTEKLNTIMGALPPQVQMVVRNLSGMTAAAKAFIATPLGLIISALAVALKAVMSYFKGTVEGEEQFAKVSGYVSGIMASLKDVLIDVGKYIVKVFTEPKQAMKDFGQFLIDQIVNRFKAVGDMIASVGRMMEDLFTGEFEKLKEDAGDFGNAFVQMATGIEDAGKKLADFGRQADEVGKKMADLSLREQKLTQQRSEWAVKKAQLQVELQETMEHMYEGSYDSQMAAAKKAMDLNEQIGAQEKKLAKEAWEIVKERNSLASSNTADLTAEKQAEAEYRSIDASTAAANKRMARTMETLRKTIEKGGVAMSEAERQAGIELVRAIEDSEYNASKAAVEAMNEGAAKELAQRKLNHERTLVEIRRQTEDREKAARESAKALWEKDSRNSNKAFDDSMLASTGKDYSKLSEQDKKVVDQYVNMVKAAQKDAETATNSENAKFFDVSDLIKQYQDYDAKRRAIEEKFSVDQKRLQDSIAQYTAQGNLEMADRAQSALNQSLIDADKERMALAMEELRADPAFLQAFEDLESVSTKTLDNLYNALQKNRDALVNLPPDQLKVITDLMKQITKTKLDRSIKPFKDLKKAVEQLKAAEASGDEDEIAKAQKHLNDTWKEAKDEVDELAEAIKALGAAIGGEAQAYMELVGSTMNFIMSSIEGVKAMARTGAEALSTIEKASVILAIVQAAIKVFQKLNEIMNKFSDSAEYEKLVAKQQEINNLTDAVNNYTLALIKAQDEEQNWFGRNDLANLASLAQQSTQIATSYYDKLYETQVKYRNKTRNDNNWTLFLDPTMGTINGAKTLTGNYEAQYVSAYENLRIETQKRKKSVLGIGGRNQETMDLRDWAKKNFNGAELFDADNWINVELAQSIIDSYGDKLQGETKQTLEQLIELKEKYDEYMESLKDYVNSLYSPLIDNFVDSMWEWFDQGKDALTQFKNYASDVFRDIVTDMMKTIVLKNIVGSFQDDIVDLYDQYNFGKIDEKQLMKQIASKTSDLMSRYEDNIPVLQNIMKAVDSILETTGIDIKSTDKSSSGSTSVAASVTQDSIDEANGRMTAIQMAQQEQLQQQMIVALNTTQMVTGIQGVSIILDDIRSLDALRNGYLTDIYERMGRMHSVMSERLESIDKNTKNI